METSELIRRASKRDISTYDNLSLYFDTVRLETDFEKARPHYERIYDIAAQQKVKLEISTPPKVVVLPSNVKEGKSAVGTYVVFTFTSSTMKP